MVVINPQKAWASIYPHVVAFPKLYLVEKGRDRDRDRDRETERERESESQALFFVTFSIIVSHNFHENFIEISPVVQKIWRFSPLILTISFGFLIFLTISYKKKLITLAYNTWCQHFMTFNLLQIIYFNNFLKILWCFSWFQFFL